MRYVFIVTYGKSGSTLLMDALNTLPGWCLRGENGGAVYHLYRHYRTLLYWHDHWRDTAPLPPSNPWFGVDEWPRWDAKDMIADLVVRTVLRPPTWATVTGFKEIRWDYDDLHDYLDWIEAAFPGARFIGNVRSVERTVRSGWWKCTENAAEIVAWLERRVRDAIASRDDRGYLVQYDDYYNKPSALRGLLDWLGEPYDAKRLKVAFGRTHGTDLASGSQRG